MPSSVTSILLSSPSLRACLRSSVFSLRFQTTLAWVFHFAKCSTCPSLVALANLRTTGWSVPTRHLLVQASVRFRVVLQINSVTDFYKLYPQRYFSRLWKVSWILFIIFVWRQVRVCFSRWRCTHTDGYTEVLRGFQNVSWKKKKTP